MARYYDLGVECFKLIECIELTPIELEGKKTLAVRLIGRLAGILGLATEAEGPLEEGDPAVRVAKLVAGAGFEPATFRL